MQDELVTTACTILPQFEFRHRKMMLKQVFFATQSNMDKYPKLFE